MNKARCVAYDFEQDVWLGFTMVGGEKNKLEL